MLDFPAPYGAYALGLHVEKQLFRAEHGQRVAFLASHVFAVGFNAIRFRSAFRAKAEIVVSLNDVIGLPLLMRATVIRTVSTIASEPSAFCEVVARHFFRVLVVNISKV